MANKRRSGMNALVVWLVVIGALNWGFVGLLGLNVVEMLFGVGALTQFLYILIGLAGLAKLWWLMGGKK